MDDSAEHVECSHEGLSREIDRFEGIFQLEKLSCVRVIDYGRPEIGKYTWVSTVQVEMVAFIVCSSSKEVVEDVKVTLAGRRRTRNARAVKMVVKALPSNDPARRRKLDFDVSTDPRRIIVCTGRGGSERL
jgi:hypothetical protein